MIGSSVRARARTTVALWAAILLGLSALGSSPAQAGESESARVIYVVDGDTFDVSFDANRSIDARIRLIGIDTPETGTCGALGAKQALEKLIEGRRVTLTADRDNANGIKGRLMRRATVVVDGKTIDVTAWMLERGWGPWMPRTGELTGNLTHHLAEAKAADLDRRYFKSARCRSGPRQNVGLKLFAQWQPDMVEGVDRLYEEFVRITNTGDAPIDLDRWHLRMGGVRTLLVPSGEPIEPGRTLTVHVGEGRNTRYHRFFNRSQPMLRNTDIDGGPHRGDGVYLLDPDWDLRAHTTWPCVPNCADPTNDSLTIRAEWDPPGWGEDEMRGEYVEITNAGTSPIHTGNFVYEVLPYVFEPPPGHWLAPGASFKIRMRSGSDTHDEMYLDSVKAYLNNDGDRVLVRTYDGIVIDCHSWGGVDCPPS